MNFINYFIKCCIRQLTKLIFNPKYFFTIVIILLFSFFILNIDSNAAEIIEDNTTADAIELIIQNENYEVQKAVEYLKKSTLLYDYNSSNVLKDFFSELRSYYVDIAFNPQTNQIIFSLYNLGGMTGEIYSDYYYPLNSPTLSLGENPYTSYVKCDCSRLLRLQTFTVEIDGTMTRNLATESVVLPICMFYHNNVGLLDVEYLWRSGSESESEFNNIVTAITESNNKIIEEEKQNTEDIINSQKENAEKIENTIISTDYDDRVVNVDTSAVDNIDDSSSTQLFTAIFDNFSNLINSSNWNQVETITIGLPFVENSGIVLRSDMIKTILGDSFLTTIINVAWYSLFGLYVFRFVTHLYHSIKSGNILGGFSFDNEVITSTML